MLRDEMLAVIADVNNQVAEREELVECIAIALLTRKNLFILGEPGQAKSYAINTFRSRITGARQFERLLSKQTDEEQLFGRIDLASLLPGGVAQAVLDSDPRYQQMHSSLKDRLANGQDAGELPEQMERHRKALAELYGSEPQVNTTGKIPESEICFIDEIFKCNDGVLNSLLTALNERKYTNISHSHDLLLRSVQRDPQEKILEALYDRLELKIVTENIFDRNKRMTILRDKQSKRNGQIAASITLEQLLDMQKEVQLVPIPDAVNDLADDILCELRRNGISISDRKYLNYYPIAQAKAWLSGHAAVQAVDLLALKNYLWRKPADRTMVEATLTRMCVNPMQDKVNNIRGMAAEAHGDFETASKDTSKPDAAKKALIKLRGELVRLYGMQQELANSSQSDSETVLTAELLDDLEKINRSAHEALQYTPIPLSQLAALQ